MYAKVVGVKLIVVSTRRCTFTSAAPPASGTWSARAWTRLPGMTRQVSRSQDPPLITMRRGLQPWAMLAALLLLVVPILAQKRDFRQLTDVEVAAIVKLDPPEWPAVDAGHMEHLLVPRICESDIVHWERADTGSGNR